mmetsp:Transcript_63097/g.56854  ORF Transcript_63097/g.56854 Transcript_63097/m.56854 type:complete len:133 (+) Transcript_63097:38-436(+)
MASKQMLRAVQNNVKHFIQHNQETINPIASFTRRPSSLTSSANTVQINVASMSSVQQPPKANPKISMKDAEKNKCGNCAKKRSLLNAQNGNEHGKDWVAFGVVFGTCIGSLFYINYQPLGLNKIGQQMDAQY